VQQAGARADVSDLHNDWPRAGQPVRIHTRSEERGVREGSDYDCLDGLIRTGERAVERIRAKGLLPSQKEQESKDE